MSEASRRLEGTTVEIRVTTLNITDNNNNKETATFLLNPGQTRIRVAESELSREFSSTLSGYHQPRPNEKDSKEEFDHDQVQIR